MRMKCEAVVEKVLKKTSATGFKDFRVGDVVEFSAEIKEAGSSWRGSTYATTISVYNKTREINVGKTFNEIGKIMECFEWKEV